MSREWRKIQAQNIRSFSVLSAHLGLETDELFALEIDSDFPINIPLRLVQKMEKGNVHDPLFLQFVPLREEKQKDIRTSCNPVGDLQAKRSEKLLHKYQGRALIVTSSVCAMHCRYCFRKEFSYAASGGFEKELAIIREDTTIQEVILSGGDPLSLSDRILQELLEALDGVPHVHMIRFHTRFPIGIPERINTHFLEMLEKIGTQIWFVVHINHPHELDADVAAHLKKVQKLGIPVLNQSVLLRGVNDTFDVHKALLEKLVAHGITPYYLHQLDRVEGAMHFEVDEQAGLLIMEQLRACLPGYAIPTFVQEIAGESSKTPLVSRSDQAWQ